MLYSPIKERQMIWKNAGFAKVLSFGLLFGGIVFAQTAVTKEKEASLKADLAGQIDGMKKQGQVMVDSVFSFGELGFQEF
jgi:aminobenzoyl-glutamate utilization protein B